MDGTVNSYFELVNIAKKIINLIPELSLAGARNID
jgi:tRNA threonylcarbamoyladenosine modification (KEOPS) complex  Pcc1 subunit